MTQVVLMQRQTPDQVSVLIGNKTKNPLPINSKKSWEDIAGLSWIFIQDSDFA